MSIDENYEVVFTEECRKEIRKVYKYIKENLYANNAAIDLMNKIEKVISNLASTPKMYVEINGYGGLKRTNKMTKTHLTPAALLDIIRKNENIL